MARLRVPGLALAAALLAMGIFRGALDHEFVWDDPIFFQKQLPHLDDLASAFAPPAGIPQMAAHYYRPLILLSYQLDEALSRSLWPPEALEQARRRVYHASPLLWHGLASALVLLLGLALDRASPARAPAPFPWLSAGWLGASAGALLFALHPIHVESVAWMAGRSDVICAVFFLASLRCYLGFREAGSGRSRGLYGLAALLLALGAMLAKEIGVGLVLLVPCVDLVLRRPPRQGGERVAWRSSAADLALAWVALLAVAAFYAVLRSGALEASGGGGLPPWSGTPTFRAVFGALAWYVRESLWPPPQSAFVAEIPGGLTAALGFVGSLLLAGGAVLVLALPRLRSWRRELLCGALFASSLAPSLAIAVARISETPLAERYLYLPSAGLCLLLGFGVERLCSLGPGRPLRVGAAAGLAGLAALALAYGWLTLQRTPVWSTDLALWTDTVSRAPGHALPHFQLGLALQRRGRLDAAEREFREALMRYDDAEGRALASASLGTLHMQRGEIEPAIRMLGESLRQNPTYASAYFNRAVCFRQLARRSAGEERQRLLGRSFQDLQRALRLNPRYVLAHLEYGELLVLTGQRDAGVAHLREVIRLEPLGSRANEARRILAGLPAEG